MPAIEDYKVSEQTYSNFINDVEYTWNVHELYVYSKHLPIFVLDLYPFIHSLKITWFQENELMLKDFLEHYRRILLVDINQPILIGPSGQVLDWLHRIVRSCLEEKKIIFAKKFEKMPPPSKIWRHNNV